MDKQEKTMIIFGIITLGSMLLFMASANDAKTVNDSLCEDYGFDESTSNPDTKDVLLVNDNKFFINCQKTTVNMNGELEISNVWKEKDRSLTHIFDSSASILIIIIVITSVSLLGVFLILRWE